MKYEIQDEGKRGNENNNIALLHMCLEQMLWSILLAIMDISFTTVGYHIISRISITVICIIMIIMIIVIAVVEVVAVAVSSLLLFILSLS